MLILTSRLSDALKALRDWLDGLVEPEGARDYVPIPVKAEKPKRKI
ncbi:hypothetical protein [Pseudaestuariivita atlantica]|nr:hypothetical protein [Pseudaestuariivita atlantica]